MQRKTFTWRGWGCNLLEFFTKKSGAGIATGPQSLFNCWGQSGDHPPQRVVNITHVISYRWEKRSLSQKKCMNGNLWPNLSLLLSSESLGRKGLFLPLQQKVSRRHGKWCCKHRSVCFGRKKWANISPTKMMIQWILSEIFFSLKCGPLLQSNSAFLAKFGKRGRGGGHLNN